MQLGRHLQILKLDHKYKSASCADCENADCYHYLDEYIFVGPCDIGSCLSLMEHFFVLCQELNIPIATVKTVWPGTYLTYFGYQLDSVTLERGSSDAIRKY